MPIYEYTCRSCEKKFEKLVKSMSGNETAECPSCGSKKTERALSAFAVSSGASRQAPPPGCGNCANAGMCGMMDE